MVRPPRIELGSSALQAAAMTTSAKVALGCLTSIDLVLPVSQTSVQATTLKTPYRNTLLATIPLASTGFRTHPQWLGECVFIW